MKNLFTLILLFSLFSELSLAQESEIDTTQIVNLDEVILIGKRDLKKEKSIKPLASIDEYLEESNKITMIKRGNYAWEPAINNMVSDRISVTIDGMQIFGACTDKMDPITSYVDISNLAEVHIKSGQQGTENGATIGGGIDMKLQKSDFGEELWDIGIDSGFETNGNATIFSSEFNYKNEKLFSNSDVMYRKSGNYYAGGNKEVLFSQYEKFNISTVLGYKTSENGAIIGSFIFDKATDIGYPALPMDVSLAQAMIGSVSYTHKNMALINNWETKLYMNSVEHVMDDSQRPDVIIHMDMPGWSDTYGFYSKAKVNKDKHELLFNINSYYNKSLAEMTMYPNNPNENEMFMLTWPDVRTWYSGVYAEDNFRLSEKENLKITSRVGFQNERVADEFGLNSLRIFYPDMEASQNRFLMSFSSAYEIKIKKLSLMIGTAYGERAPSVSEGYGFYLFNSYDNFDYIGNPYLNKEQSLEFNGEVRYNLKGLTFSIEASYFHMNNYIIGQIDPTLSPMTIGASGVKIYSALDYATIFDANLNVSYLFLGNWKLDGSVGYSYGKDNFGENLPLISPVSYKAGINYKKNLFQAEINMEGASKQYDYAADYGEDQSEAYTVFNASTSYNFYFGSHKMFAKAGISNIFDTFYSTFADWNNIPRMGRNVFLNLTYLIK